MQQNLCSFLMGLFAFFSSQPVVDLAVSMTFIPAALPMFFKDNVDVELCFEVASSTTASNPGNGCLVGCPGVVVIPDWLVGTVRVPFLKSGCCLVKCVCPRKQVS